MSLHSPADILKAHVGYNTGFLHQHRHCFPTAVEWAYEQSPRNIELSAHEAQEMPLLAEYINSEHVKEWLPRFDTVSVHGPTFGWDGDGEFVEYMRLVPDWITRIVYTPAACQENYHV